MNDFFKWLDQEKHQRPDSPEFRDLETLWENSRVENVIPPSDAMWAAIRQRMDAYPKPKILWFHAAARKPAYWAVAAILVVGMLLPWLLQSDAPVMIAAERGIDRKVVALKDKSQVVLSAGTSLELGKGFNHDHRNVVLEGEAFFEVKKGEQPFIVQAGDARVRVVGTRFNVATWGGQTRLAVTEGVVEFSTDPTNPAKTVTLHAGESSLIQDGAPVKPVPSKQSEPSWLQDRLDYQDMPFTNICEHVSRRFNVQIVILDPKLAATKVAGSLETKDLETTMAALAFAVGGTLEKRGDTYILSPGDSAQQ